MTIQNKSWVRIRVRDWHRHRVRNRVRVGVRAAKYRSVMCTTILNCEVLCSDSAVLEDG